MRNLPQFFLGYLFVLLLIGWSGHAWAQPGDNCTNSLDLALLTSPYSGTTVGFADDIDDGFTTGPDRVFHVDIPNGYTILIYQSVNSFNSRFHMAYGGACPGENLILNFDEPDLSHAIWRNTTGATQRFYFVLGGSGGESGTFTLVWELKLTQAITFGAIPTKAFGDAPFTVSATGGPSGNPVTFTSSNTAVATCTGTNGATVTIVGYGTCTIYANQAGNGTYAAALQVGQPLSIAHPDDNCSNGTNLALLTTPYSSTTATYVDDIDDGYTLGPDRMFYYDVPNGKTINIWQSVNSFDSKVHAAYGGVCPGTTLIANLNDPDETHVVWENNTGVTQRFYYVIGGAWDNGYGTFTLNWNIGQNQIIAFGPLPSKTFGDAPFTVSATGGASGNPVTFTSSNTAVATCSGTNGTTVTIVGGGTCTIYANQAGNGVYTAALQVGQPLSIKQLDDNCSNSTSLALLTSPYSSTTATYVDDIDDGYTTGPDRVFHYDVPNGSTIEVWQSVNSFDSQVHAAYGGACPGATLIQNFDDPDENHIVWANNTGTTQRFYYVLGGYGGQSGTFTLNWVVKLSQTITFGPLPTKVFGDTPFTVSATGGASGNPVTFTSSNTAVATCTGTNGATVTIVGGGTCTIYANQAGNGTYAAALQVGQPLSIAQPDDNCSNGINLALLTSPYSSTTATYIDDINDGYTSGPDRMFYYDVPNGKTINIWQSNNSFDSKVHAAYGGACPGTTLITNFNDPDDNHIVWENNTGVTQRFYYVIGGAWVNDYGTFTLNWNIGLNQAITFGPLPSKTFGDAPFTVSATGGASGNPVTFTSSNTSVATCTGTNGATVTIVGYGTCTILANQAGNGVYAAALQVGQPLTIAHPDDNCSNSTSLALLTSPYSSTTATYVDDIDDGYTTGPDRVFHYDVPSGSTIEVWQSVNSFDSQVHAAYGGACPGATLIQNIDEPDDAHTIWVNTTGTTQRFYYVLGGYNGQSGTFTLNWVVKLSQTITFGPLPTKTFGDAPFTVSATGGASGNPVTFTSSNTAVATCTGPNGATVTIVGRGTCTIRANQAGNGAYAAALQVGQPLSIAQPDDNCSNGTNLEALTSPYSGTTATYIDDIDDGYTTGPDRMFYYDVPNGSAIEVWQSVNNFDSQVHAAYGGACPGATLIQNIDEPDDAHTIWVNNTGTTQRFYYVLGGYDGQSGTFTLNWLIKLSQTITFGPLPSKTVGDAPFTVSATGGASGNPVTFTSSNTAVATCTGTNGATVTIVGYGACTIYANQAGNSTYTAATQVGQILSVPRDGDNCSNSINLALLASPYNETTANYLNDIDDGYTEGPDRIFYYDVINGATIDIWQSVNSFDSKIHAAFGGTCPGATLIKDFDDPDETHTIWTNTTGTTQRFYYVLGGYNGQSGTFTLNWTIKLPQTITFTPFTTPITYGAPTFNLTATATSTLGVTFSSDNVSVATVSGNTVTIVGAGNANIRANQAGNGSYNAAPQVSLLLTVNKKQITVTAAAKAKVYGNSDPALTYTFTPALVGSDAFTGSLSRAAGEAVGTYAINKNTLALSSNYAITYNTANLSITAKPITVTAAAKAKVYGDSDPALTYTFTPVLVGSDAFTGALSRAAGEAVGAYAINQNTLALSSNYTITYNTANLSITAKPITVTAAAKAKVYGNSDPALTYTFTPVLVGSDAFTGALSRAAGEAVGTYAINKNTLALSSNYTITYNTANLSITAKPITVTAAAKAKAYGDSDPALTYTYTPALVGSDAFTGALSRAVGEAVGTYAINKNTLALSSNYTITYNTANLSITAKPITVTAAAKAKVYGDSDPALTYTYTPALVGGDAFTGALSRAAGEAVGTYAINKNTLALSSNYTITYNTANLSITAKPITVTAVAQTKVYGDSDPELTYTCTPGLLGGDTFTGILSRTQGENVGTYAINKNTLALSSNYTMTYNTEYLSITAKPITVTAAAQTKVYGDSDPELTYTITPALVGSDAFTGALSRAAGEAVGTYAINKNTLALSSNYTMTYNPENLSITAKPITVTAAAQTKVYGDSDPALTYTYTPALLGGDTFTGTLSRTQGENVGTYAINQGSVTAGSNYNLLFAGDNLSVTAKELTVTAVDRNKTYGDENPAFTVTYGGFVGAEDENSLITAPTAATTATQFSDANAYSIVPSGGVAANYTFSYINGTLLVNKAILNVTADNATRKKGEVNPTFTLSYAGFKGADEASIIDILPTASTTADVSSEAGEYDIILTGGSDNNYTFELHNGRLTVYPQTGITTDNVVEYIVYPNPANNYVNITNLPPKTTIRIFNVQGQLIRSLISSGGLEIIDISSLTSGVYMIRLSGDGVDTVLNIVKKRGE